MAFIISCRWPHTSGRRAARKCTTSTAALRGNSPAARRTPTVKRKLTALVERQPRVGRARSGQLEFQTAVALHRDMSDQGVLVGGRKDQEVVGQRIRADHLLRLTFLVHLPGELLVRGQRQVQLRAIRPRGLPMPDKDCLLDRLVCGNRCFRLRRCRSRAVPSSCGVIGRQLIVRLDG